MRSLRLLGLACLGLGLATLWLTAPAGQAQDAKNTEKVRFTTVDGVEIHGTFFPSSKRTPPTVLILHALGEDSKKKGYVSLAEELQKNGFAVMTFDFRGHGDSKEVSNDFWLPQYAFNKAYVKSRNANAIEFKDFAKNYYPVLVNDIAAAKAFLDRKNDSGACNTSSFILVGAETGATLGALWQHSEWFRYKMIPPPMFGFPAKPDSRPEGKDIICSIWLSITPSLGVKTVTLSSLMERSSKIQATPTLLLYGEGDAKGKELNKLLEKALKVAKEKEKYRYTMSYGVKDTDLKGVGLLQPSLATDKAITEYLQEVVQNKGNEWVEREFRKTQYVWQLQGKLVPARVQPTEMNLVYDTYEKFLLYR